MSARTRIGGQAVPEGVMLRGSRGWAVAVRRPDGEIVVRRQALRARMGWSLHRVPLLRGLLMLFAALPLGVRALLWASSQAGGHTTDELQRTRGRRAMVNAVTLVFGLAFAWFLFGWLPAAAARVVTSQVTAAAWVEAIFRIGAIGLYIALLNLLPSVRRVFGYHGAEHQVVGAYEAGLEVTPASAANFPRLHPRCGSTFVVLLALCHALLRGFVPASIPGGSVVRALALPISIMIAFELLSLGAQKPGTWWTRALLSPGTALQRLTTRPASHDQLEVACVALNAVLSLEQSSLEDHDQQQDDQQQDEQTATYVHGASLRVS
ncbi:MAG TPA: DUF1385 domain-containing protein [Acidimicrobiales bacterium]|nr:DUF1385 domain-containing protein [Acidimicrobiales bacterium]